MENKNIENLINFEFLCLINNNKITNKAFKKLNKINTLILFGQKITSTVLQYLPNIEFDVQMIQCIMLIMINL